MDKAKWAELLSPARIGKWVKQSPIAVDGRSEFDRDYDRIIFSSAFRRLQDKTQVFPFSPSDYTRTRLTHSIEVASVGHTFGRRVGTLLKVKDLLPDDISPGDVGTIVASACLAHDTGNPPFGHSGESAIQHWAKGKFNTTPSLVENITDTAQREDFLEFEGNAQSFRIFSKLQARERLGGLQLTLATFGALVKYPRPSVFDLAIHSGASVKKFGYFQDEADLAVQSFQMLGLKERASGVFARHPLAFLMEAADDVCNRLIDLEDACQLRVISVEMLTEYLMPIAKQYKPDIEVNPKSEISSQLGLLRAASMSALVNQCMAVFEDNLDAIVSGDFDSPLILNTESYLDYKSILDLESEKVFTDHRVLEVEYAGFQAISGLLEMYHEAVLDSEGSDKSKKLFSLFPMGHLQLTPVLRDTKQEYLNQMTPYQKLMVVTDYVAGMTDSFALDQYQKLSGIKLPR